MPDTPQKSCMQEILKLEMISDITTSTTRQLATNFLIILLSVVVSSCRSNIYSYHFLKVKYYFHIAILVKEVFETQKLGLTSKLQQVILQNFLVSLQERKSENAKYMFIDL